MEQNERFPEGMSPEKIQVDPVLNRRLAAIIDFNMRNIWKVVPDS